MNTTQSVAGQRAAVEQLALAARQLIAWGTPPQAKGTRPRCRDTSTGTDSAHAELLGVAKRVRGSLWQADPVIRDRYAEELPALWEALAAMVEFVDEQAPPFPKPDGS